MWVYSGNEERQLWDTSSAPPSGDEGGTFWLPGGVTATIKVRAAAVPGGLGRGS